MVGSKERKATMNEASTGTLMLDTGKSVLVTRDQLKQIPLPNPTGRFHRPIPHYDFATSIRNEVEGCGFEVRREQIAIKSKGHQMFGVMDLIRRTKEGQIDFFSPDGTAASRSTWSIGFRGSTDNALSEQIVGGGRVFVCDNLMMSGDSILLKHKSTTNFDLENAVATAFRHYLDQRVDWMQHLKRMAEHQLKDVSAKEVIYDLVTDGVIPTRLLFKVDKQYFQADKETPDCQPRTMWGLYNSFTRTVKEMTPARMFEATQEIGKRFQEVVN
jgi:hypothetical protein